MFRIQLKILFHTVSKSNFSILRAGRSCKANDCNTQAIVKLDCIEQQTVYGN